MPMYDADTKILVVTGKGDSGTRYYEFAPDANKTQYLYEIGTVAGTDPHSGACLLPKRSMSFMDCEVIRLLKLGSKDVLTVKFEVPRKSHSEVCKGGGGRVKIRSLARLCVLSFRLHPCS